MRSLDGQDPITVLPHIVLPKSIHIFTQAFVRVIAMKQKDSING